MGTIEFPKTPDKTGKKIKKENIAVQKGQLFVNDCISVIKMKKSMIEEVWRVYGDATKDADMRDSNISFHSIAYFLYSDLDAEQAAHQHLPFIEQVDKNGNKYELVVIINKEENKNYAVASITKETKSHILYCYSNGSWHKTTWEKYYGHTYQQHVILQEDSIRSAVLYTVLRSAKISDKAFEELFTKNEPLIRLCTQYTDLEFDYIANKPETLILIPTEPVIGVAFTYDNGEFVISQYGPASLDTDEYELYPVGRTDSMGVSQFIEKNLIPCFIDQHTQCSNAYKVVIPFSTESCVSYNEDQDISLKELIEKYQLTEKEINILKHSQLLPD